MHQQPCLFVWRLHIQMPLKNFNLGHAYNFKGRLLLSLRRFFKRIPAGVVKFNTH